MLDPAIQVGDVQRFPACADQPQNIAPLTIRYPVAVQEPTELVEEHVLGLGERESLGGRTRPNFHHPQSFTHLTERPVFFWS